MFYAKLNDNIKGFIELIFKKSRSPLSELALLNIDANLIDNSLINNYFNKIFSNNKNKDKFDQDKYLKCYYSNNFFSNYEFLQEYFLSSEKLKDVIFDNLLIWFRLGEKVRTFNLFTNSYYKHREFQEKFLLKNVDRLKEYLILIQELFSTSTIVILNRLNFFELLEKVEKKSLIYLIGQTEIPEIEIFLEEQIASSKS